MAGFLIWQPQGIQAWGKQVHPLAWLDRDCLCYFRLAHLLVRYVEQDHCSSLYRQATREESRRRFQGLM